MAESTKQSRWSRRKQTWAQLWQAFNIQRKQDKALLPLMLLCIIGIPVVMFLIGLTFNWEWSLLIIGIAIGLAVAMFVFSKRMEKNVYAQAEGQPGAAAWVLENLRASLGMVWKTKTSLAMTPQMDAVHRTVGLCGVVLVAEGDKSRVQPLMAQQKKRVHRLAPNTPVYEIYTGTGEGQVPLKNLNRELVRLPRNFSKEQVYALAAKLDTMDARQNPMNQIPKGPIPKGAKVAGMNRRARRAQNRGK